MKNSDIRRVRRFANIFRFVDDLKVLNEDWECERSFKEIYPLELELQKKGFS